MKLTMKRRLLAVAALAAIAVAQVIPASAGSVSVSHGSCPYYNATGQSYQVSPTHSYGQTAVQQSCGYLAVWAYFYDPVLGEYYEDEGLKAGASTSYYDSVSVVTPVFSYHRYGPNSWAYTTQTSGG
ncbi:MAG TPA: hypothetical protein VFK32_02850 [Tepidiformaceae bacterium]|nr:hypothetical protein [Tepidiformaceae bacterium]